MNRVTLIIPAYRPDEKIIETINDALETGFNDIIIVDDGSESECNVILDKIENIPECVLLKLEKNIGKGRALKTALSFYLENRSDSLGVVTLDADGKYLPQDIKAVCETMEESGKIVIGCRDFSQKNVPLGVKVGNKLTCAVFRVFFGMKISDTQTGLRAFPRTMVPEILKVKGERYEYETQMLISMSRNNIPFEEIEVGTAGDNKRNHFRTVRDSIRIYAVVLKYIFSSLFATLVDEGAFFIFKFFPFLSFIPIPLTITAAFAARLVSSFVNFLINSNLVFDEKFSSKVLMKYYTLVIVQISVSASCVYAIEHILHVRSAMVVTLIKILVDIILFFFSFRIQHKWVFKTKPDKQ